MQTTSPTSFKYEGEEKAATAVDVVQNVAKATLFCWFEIKRMTFFESRERKTNRYVALSAILRRLSSIFHSIMHNADENETNKYQQTFAMRERDLHNRSCKPLLY